jgi:gliding motility-associated-like protein
MYWRCQAQNLVPNPSFEEYFGCPSYFSMMHTVKYWQVPNRGSTDYLNACAGDTKVGVPFSYFGHQTARTGDAYAGIHPMQMGRNYREYLQVKLKEPLRSGETYKIEFYVSLSSKFNIAISNLGAYLSVEPPTSGGDGLLGNMTEPPQIQNPAGNLLTDTLGWTSIRGEYVAKGGEQYLTIGNFDDDDHTHYLSSATSAQYSYYYIDDVSVFSCPIETDLGLDRVICQNDVFTLDATSPGATYRWQDGSTLPTFQGKGPGTYWVDVTTATCSFRDSVKVTTLGDSYDLMKNVTQCPTGVTVLNAYFKGALSYRWQDGSTRPTYSTATPGIYWVEVQLAHCSFRDTVEVLAFENRLPQSARLCPGDSLTLDARIEGQATYLWSDGFTEPVRTITSPGFYQVTVRMGDCFYLEEVIQVSFLETGLPPMLTICTGVTHQLKPRLLEALSYRWQDGSTGSFLDVKAPGIYWVDVVTPICTFRDSVVVYQLDADQLDRLKDRNLCSKDGFLLNAELPGAIGYRWQDGSLDPEYYINRSGVYWVDIDLGACSFRDSVRVQYYDSLPPLLPPLINLCPGQTYTLDVSSMTGPYRWQDGSSLPTFQVNTPGIYSVEYRWNGCIAHSTTVVNYYPKPVFQVLQADSTFCYGQSQVLEVTGKNMAFRWQDGNTGHQYTIEQPGEYWVEGRDLATGCTERKTFLIEIVECQADLNIPNIITPNGDDTNQYFVIKGITDHWNLEIFNRWGEQVYQAQGYANNWEAREQPVGLYYYHLRNPYSGQSYKGWLQVLR